MPKPLNSITGKIIMANDNLTPEEAAQALDAATEKKKKSQKGSGEFTDEFLTLSFVENHAAIIRYTDAWNRKWSIWFGTHWLRDQTQAVRNLARDYTRVIEARVTDYKTQNHILSMRTSSAIVSLSGTDRSIAMHPSQWDPDPWLLATPSGTIDLRTNTLRRANPNDYITRVTTVAPGGSCPLWLDTLRQIFPEDPEKIEFLQRWFGYCLTGVTREEKFLFMNGSGRNGKGTILGTIQWIMGEDYSTPLVAEVLMRVTVGAPKDTDLADLRAARMVVASEIAEGAKWNIQRLKDITGGDRLLARKLYEDLTPFKPTHKLIVQGNNLPKLGHVDTAISSRLILLMFNESFEGDKNPNTKLKDDLQLEGGGILKWMLEGCRKWLHDGLAVPERMIKETDEYLKTMSDIALWIDARCQLEDDVAGTHYTTKGLFENYCAWRKETGEGVFITNREFTHRLKAHGRGIKVSNHQSGAYRRVTGIMLTPIIDTRPEMDSASNGLFRGV
jgi:putative DNA primase/helicase